MKEEVQVFRNELRWTAAGRNDGSAWGVGFVYFREEVESGLFSVRLQQKFGSGGKIVVFDLFFNCICDLFLVEGEGGLREWFV